ncbi:hypothetical protein Glove_198g104 [Diversispora epigaea]|uniref:Uncharacterized protein n=1 Tax=Diversispora epigaea TaxID=1348612 RepID=A0A397IRK3_9GLOM|nr:hypothetical protein Glove_198g104 [Diversispora epigaea]
MINLFLFNSKAIQNVPSVQNDSDNDILDINNAPNLTSKASQKGKGNQDVENGSDNKDDGILTLELEEVYKKLDKRQKERYRRCKNMGEKIVLFEGIMSERKKGKYEIASVFNAISVLTTIAITVTANKVSFNNRDIAIGATAVFILSLLFTLHLSSFVLYSSFFVLHPSSFVHHLSSLYFILHPRIAYCGDNGELEGWYKDRSGKRVA